MGTRADFYVGRGPTAEWLGSIAWDGYPSGIDEEVLKANSVEVYREAVSTFLKCEDGTLPEMGWPWPWNDSNTTDYAYALDEGHVYASCFGHPWFEVRVDADGYGEPEDDDSPKGLDFPDMSAFKNVAYGYRSGTIIVSGGQ